MSGRLDMDCITGLGKREEGDVGEPRPAEGSGDLGGRQAAAPSARGASAPLEAVLAVLRDLLRGRSTTMDEQRQQLSRDDVCW